MSNREKMQIEKNREFINFVKDIKEKILSLQYQALKKVNRELISLYWSIGKDIIEKQKEFVGIRRFSIQNLWNMRQFYLEYYKDEKLQPLVGEISWTKNIIIFQKVKDIFAREFYIKSVIKFGWTKDLLINYIDSKSYEKFLVNQTNFDKSLPQKYKYQAKFAVIEYLRTLNEK